MKIGIISINAHTKVLNFASPLHSYVFQQFLNQHGIDNVIIDYKPCYYGKFDVRHPYDYYLEHPDSNEAKQARLLDRWKLLYEEREKRFDLIEEFIQKNYVKTSRCFDQNVLDKVDPKCDIYMCVTDVIWKYNPKTGFDRGYFLAGKKMEGKGKIAYAASRGAKGYTVEQAAYFRELIAPFDYISVREQSLCDYVNQEGKKEAQLVVDPVFLQEKEFYQNLSKKPPHEKYVLIYTVMENARPLVETAVRFAQERNLKVIELSEDIHNRNYPEGTSHEVIYGIGIEDWLGYMEHAEYIFTNSFHCCCFSIILQKEFYAGPRSGDKVDWVLELFGLKDRKIVPGKPFAQGKIDFEKVEILRKRYKAISEKYVLDAIHNVSFRIRHPRMNRWISKFRKPKSLRGIQKEDMKP